MLVKFIEIKNLIESNNSEILLYKCESDFLIS